MQLPREGLALLFLRVDQLLRKPSKPLFRLDKAHPMLAGAFLEPGQAINADYGSEQGEAQRISE